MKDIVRRFALGSVFVAVFALAVGAGAQTTHEVQMMITPVEGRQLPDFYFEPVGLLVQPGDTVRFVAATPHHTATAYHAQHVKSDRVPAGVEPFSSPVVPIGDAWEYTFTVPGTYDIWCGPHEHYGMAMRIVVGQPGGPAEEPITDRSPMGVYALAAAVLSHPALASSEIVERGSVSWYDLPDDVRPQQVTPDPEGGPPRRAPLVDVRTALCSTRANEVRTRACGSNAPHQGVAPPGRSFPWAQLHMGIAHGSAASFAPS